jgi:hypothetical protein
MQPVTPDEILDNRSYEQARPEIRSAVLAIKALRRVPVGPNFTILFENHATVLYQVQEMMRIEGITDSRAIQHEIDTYNELIPPAGGLSATLLIEFEDAQVRARELPKLLGIERHLWLRVGDLPPVQATFDTRQIGDDRVSAVQYLTFTLPSVHRRLWLGFAQARPGDAGPGGIRLAVDHPHYTWQALLPPEVAKALAEDFA